MVYGESIKGRTEAFFIADPLLVNLSTVLLEKTGFLVNCTARFGELYCSFLHTIQRIHKSFCHACMQQSLNQTCIVQLHVFTSIC